MKCALDPGGTAAFQLQLEVHTDTAQVTAAQAGGRATAGRNQGDCLGSAAARLESQRVTADGAAGAGGWLGTTRPADQAMSTTRPVRADS